MCGICGYLSRVGPVREEVVTSMTRTLVHRGPDAEGVQCDGALGLGHRRLSIIDLSEAAMEPIRNEDGSLWLVLNGEIYNFRALRRQLAGRHRFSSQGDAETILHLYEERGEDAVRALDGMFAFVLWDVRRRRLLLARDRTGKKPLFYHDGPELFAFASEVKALLAHPGVPHEKDESALPLYLTYGYVPTPATFYRGIRALPPGHWLVVTEESVEGPTPYWEPRFRHDDTLDEREAELRLRALLRQAVEKRLVADVPLGAFLSGGIDSATVVAFMAQAAGARVKTFTIGFADAASYDEREDARRVATLFGTDHTEFVVEPTSVDIVDRLVWHHDGPFGDSSAVPTYLLSELTRKQVTVALNGDGGDDVFAGYLRFYAGALSEEIPSWLFRILDETVGLLPEPCDRRHPLRFLKRFAEAGRLPLAERYLRWTGIFPDGLPGLLRPELRPHADRARLLESSARHLNGSGSALDRLLQLNFRTYLPDDLHVKMDRMSMAHALETRSPFLDTAVVEFGASLPDRLRMRFGRGKLLLRRAMKGILPPSTLARGKSGFGAPLGSWFRGALGSFVRERLLDSASPLYDCLLPEAVATLVRQHDEGAADLSPQIWALLTLESWMRQEGQWSIPRR
jgi:asparagine synthase (glutamine-hydrolysing)